ncbi:hypothetical protein DL764_004779 [Monosporascus ibericus]|uniref:DUF7580 domain-containing protein n=1 Tax=Monosporascus ibericus TaxID=155417 RepID=A0A4Q4TBE3_9PEZI|nr:hypothetical protein DL764_004779 [Monosporascus ibericus]
MSGFEIAGVVLGAFPIAILGLEKYREVAKRFGFWHQIRLEYQKTSNELKFHKLSFVRNLKQLLLPLVVDDADVQKLISDPGGKAWKDDAVAKALEGRLQESHGLYLEIMGEMERVMGELNKELAVDVEGVQKALKAQKGVKDAQSANVSTMTKLRPPFNKVSREYQIYRFKFSMGETTRTGLFKELQTYNDRLEKLVTTSDIVSNLKTARQAAQATTASVIDVAICKFWNRADGLYRALLGSWTCICREDHSAHLLLQHRKPPDKHFRLVLSSNSPGNVPGKAAWSTCRIRAEAAQAAQAGHAGATVAKAVSTKLSVQISTPQHRTLAPGKTALSSHRKGHACSVKGRHGVPTVTIPFPGPPACTSGTSSRTLAVNTEDKHLITNLCQSLSTGIQTEFSAGYLEDDEKRYYVFPESTTATSRSEPSVSLGEILSGKIKPALTRRQRLYLSVTLASSFVQLRDTPWISVPWGKQQVFFSHDGDNTNALLLDQPYVVRNFAAAPAKAAALDPQDIGVSSLGIVLLELCFGHVIEQHPSRLRLPSGEENETIKSAFDLIAALEWLKEVNDEVGADFADAVEWCLAGPPSVTVIRAVRNGDPVKDVERMEFMVPLPALARSQFKLEGTSPWSLMVGKWIEHQGRIDLDKVAAYIARETIYDQWCSDTIGELADMQFYHQPSCSAPYGACGCPAFPRGPKVPLLKGYLTSEEHACGLWDVLCHPYAGASRAFGDDAPPWLAWKTGQRNPVLRPLPMGRANLAGTMVRIGQPKDLNSQAQQNLGVKLCLDGVRRVLTASNDLIENYGLIRTGDGAGTQQQLPPFPQRWITYAAACERHFQSTGSRTPSPAFSVEPDGQYAIRGSSELWWKI